jgi:hypothetical protein
MYSPEERKQMEREAKIFNFFERVIVWTIIVIGLIFIVGK